MAKTKKPPADEDPEKSNRFLEIAQKLGAAGELNFTVAEAALDRMVKHPKARSATKDPS